MGKRKHLSESKSEASKCPTDPAIAAPKTTDVNVLISLASQNSEERQTWWMENMPSELILRDDDLIEDVLDMGLQTLDDMVEYFCLEERLGDDECVLSGPPKFEYEEGDSYDWHLAMGCLNCGRPHDIHYHHFQMLDALVCTGCGHRACPKHFAIESDSLVERMEGRHLTTKTSEKNSSTLRPTYLYGSRKQHNFGQFDKSWWQDNFLPQAYRDKKMVHHLRVVTTMGQKKGVTCQEECLLCGHDRAFYQVYQARSADEGMTIMFECCNCKHRKVFNN